MKALLFLIILYILSTSAKHRQKTCSNCQTAAPPTTGSKADDEDDDDYDMKVDYEDKSEVFPEYEKVNCFAGTNLFGDGTSQCSKLCLSNEKIALLRVRKDFEQLLPKDLPKTLMDDKFITSLMHYFYGADQVILRMCNGNLKVITEKAFYDTLGGYLHWYLLPVMKTSFYAGLICLKTAQNVIDLYRQCKINLNTNGNLWRAPIMDFTEFDIQIVPIQIFMNAEQDETSCVHLDLSDDRSENDDEMIVSLPKLDLEEKGLLTNIWLPFKRKKTFNLRSVYSAFIVLKYFETVSRCYKFEGICQKGFNSRLKDWLQENIESHLDDDILYPGLGAVSRILQTVRHDKPVVVNPEDKKQKRDEMEVEVEDNFSKRRKTPEFTKISSKAKKLEHKKYGHDFIDELFRSKGTRSQLNGDDYHEIKDEQKKESLEEEEEESSMNYTMIFLVGGIAVSSTAFLVLLMMMITAKNESPQQEFEHSQSPTCNAVITCFGLCSRRAKYVAEDEESLIESQKMGKTNKKPTPYAGQDRNRKGRL